MSAISSIGQNTPSINTSIAPISTSIGQGVQGGSSLDSLSSGTKALTLGDGTTKQANATGSGTTKPCGAAGAGSSCSKGSGGASKAGGDDDENSLIALLKKMLPLLSSGSTSLGGVSKAA